MDISVEVMALIAVIGVVGLLWVSWQFTPNRVVRRQDVVLGGATADDLAKTSKLALIFAFIISLLVLLPALFVVFIKGDAAHPAYGLSTSMVGGVVGFWIGKGPEMVRK